MIKPSHFLHVCDTFLNTSVLGTTDWPELIYFNKAPPEMLQG